MELSQDVQNKLERISKLPVAARVAIMVVLGVMLVFMGIVMAILGLMDWLAS